jgi:molybdate transport system permease protein
MDWTALGLSLRLGLVTVLLLLPLAFVLARALAFGRWRGRALVEALVALPLLLPPTVIGYYLLVAFGRASPLGEAFASLTGRPLAFSFEGLVLASLLVNLPFAVQPMQNALAAIPESVRDAARCCGLSPAGALRHIELPLALPGIATAAVLTFAHTLGEFGVVLMVGGSIPGETRTASIAIYDRVQAFDESGATVMSLVLLLIAVAALAATNALARRGARRQG